MDPNPEIEDHREGCDHAHGHGHGRVAAHTHTHGHGHHHHHGLFIGDHMDRRLGLGALINLAYVLFEAFVGWRIESLSLIADAGHNLSDVMAILLAWGARRLESLPTSRRRTYGWKHASILSAQINGLLLLAGIGWIVWEAVARFTSPVTVPPAMPLMLVASVGVVINSVTAWLLLMPEGDLNVRAAMWHMVADAAVSLAVVIGGAAIWATGQSWIDPALCLLVAGVLLLSTWGLLVEAFNLALGAVPAQVDPEAVRSYLERLEGITAVHDLHIWSTGTRQITLTGHLVKPVVEDEDRFLTRVAGELRDQFGIGHTTLQIERAACGADCARRS